MTNLKREVMNKMWQLIREDQKKTGPNYRYSKRVKLKEAWRLITKKAKMVTMRDVIVSGMYAPDWFINKNNLNSGVYETIRETEKAILAEDSCGIQVWFPKSILK